MSAQLMQTTAPGWRRVATPRYKKDYKGKHVTAEDFSYARGEIMKSPQTGQSASWSVAPRRVPAMSFSCT